MFAELTIVVVSKMLWPLFKNKVFFNKKDERAVCSN